MLWSHRHNAKPARRRFLFHSVGATLAVARGRGRAPPLRTTNNASVGADAYIGPLYRTPCKTPCHCEPVTDVTGVAIRNPRPLGPLA